MHAQTRLNLLPGKLRHISTRINGMLDILVDCAPKDSTTKDSTTKDSTKQQLQDLFIA